MGQDKRRLRLWGSEGPTLLERTLTLASSLCPDLVVVLNDAAAWPGLPGRLVADQYADAGVLGALYTGLLAATEPYALVLAADLPCLSLPLLTAMLALPRDYDVLVPHSPWPVDRRNHRGLEPLHAVYSRHCCDVLRAALNQGERQVVACFAQLRLRLLEPAFLATYDPHEQALLNLNTPAQLAEVLSCCRLTHSSASTR